MTQSEIYTLLDLLPAGISLTGELVDKAPPTSFHQHKQKMLRYSAAYANLQFGWHYVQRLLDEGLEFTRTMRDHGGPAMVAAYNYFARNTNDQNVMEAWMLAAAPERKAERHIVEAALCSKDYTLEEAAEFTGLSKDSIAIYEKLFFNIVDRRRESLFIATVLYPNSRLVEMFEGYLSDPTTCFPQLLKRSGYVNSIKDVMYFAGHPDGNGLLASLASRETPERLEALIMANGYLLARNGWINQRSLGISQARGLMAAAKAGGEQRSASLDSPFTSLGSSLSDELVTCKRAEAKESLALAKTVHELESDIAKARDS
jgi:hypothetical protein